MDLLVKKKQKTDKVIFIGGFGVGKTTALNNLSNIPIVHNSVQSARSVDTVMGDDGKKHSLGFEYGEWLLSNNRKVHLYGIANQEDFISVCDIIVPDSAAVVIIVQGDREEGLADCQRSINLLKKYGVLSKVCIAVTRLEASNEWVLHKYRSMLKPYQKFTPVVTADTRDKESVIQTVLIALSTPL